MFNISIGVLVTTMCTNIILHSVLVQKKSRRIRLLGEPGGLHPTLCPIKFEFRELQVV
jgi:hypothetical protein